MNDFFLHKKHIKKALSKSTHPDLFTISRYRFSPYMACSHGCIYCDGRAEKYYIKGDFEKDIIVRPNILEMLLKELSILREKGPVCISSGVTDAYQPVEEVTELTRKCLEVLSFFDLPVNLLTKSVLIERDLDIISRINESNPVTVFISLVHLDDKIRKIFEPKAASVESRLKLISNLKQAGCNVGILAMPFIPFAGDSGELVDSLFNEVINRGADFIMAGSMTLRPGRQKDLFFRRIREYYPQSLEKYKEIFSNNLSSGMPVWQYRKEINQIFSNAYEKYKVDTMVPHRVYKNTLTGGDQLYVLLCQLSDVYSRKGVNTYKLYKSIKSYSDFLQNEKKEFGKNIAANTEYMNKLIPRLCEKGKINEILNNSKLSDFVSEIYLKNKVFDFKTLKII